MKFKYVWFAVGARARHRQGGDMTMTVTVVTELDQSGLMILMVPESIRSHWKLETQKRSSTRRRNFLNGLHNNGNFFGGFHNIDSGDHYPKPLNWAPIVDCNFDACRAERTGAGSLGARCSPVGYNT